MIKYFPGCQSSNFGIQPQKQQSLPLCARFSISSTSPSFGLFSSCISSPCSAYNEETDKGRLKSLIDIKIENT